MDKERRFPIVLSSFWLKIIALLTMTIDHVGIILQGLEIQPIGDIFRIIGRIALPLFCFMIAEGAIHTKNFRKYALRLGIMASVVSLIIIGSNEIPFFRDSGLSMRGEGVIFVDLLLGAVSVYLLRQDKWYIKILAILPLAFGIASFIADEFDWCGCQGQIWWIPYFIRTQYGWYGVLLVIVFYLAHQLSQLFIKFASQISQIPYETYEGSYFERNTLNVISAFMLGIVTVLYFYICDLTPEKYAFWQGFHYFQIYAILAGVFILLYSGLRGYNKKWFQYGSYLYYLLHMLIIGVIFYLIFM